MPSDAGQAFISRAARRLTLPSADVAARDEFRSDALFEMPPKKGIVCEFCEIPKDSPWAKMMRWPTCF